MNAICFSFIFTTLRWLWSFSPPPPQFFHPHLIYQPLQTIFTSTQVHKLFRRFHINLQSAQGFAFLRGAQAYCQCQYSMLKTQNQMELKILELYKQSSNFIPPSRTKI